MRTIQITSFGYGHAPAPEANIVLDVRRALHDPHFDPAMRELTARDERVLDHVAATPGAAELLDYLADLAHTLGRHTRTDQPGPAVTIAIGCTGGRHRAPALAQLAIDRICALGWHVEVINRDIDKSVIGHRPTEN